VLFFWVFLTHVSFEYETINKLSPLNVVFHVIRGPMPQNAGTPSLSQLQFFYLSIISIAVLENVSPTQGYSKEPPFSSTFKLRKRSNEQQKVFFYSFFSNFFCSLLLRGHFYIKTYETFFSTIKLLKSIFFPESSTN
jgi:hypothetical protein